MSDFPSKPRVLVLEPTGPDPAIVLCCFCTKSSEAVTNMVFSPITDKYICEACIYQTFRELCWMATQPCLASVDELAALLRYVPLMQQRLDALAQPRTKGETGQ